MAREGAHPDDVTTPQATTPRGGRHLVYDGQRPHLPQQREAQRLGDRSQDGRRLYRAARARNGRMWLKPLATPIAQAPKWIRPAPAAELASPSAARPFTGETPYARTALERACAAIRSAPNGAQEVDAQQGMLLASAAWSAAAILSSRPRSAALTGGRRGHAGLPGAVARSRDEGPPCGRGRHA